MLWVRRLNVAKRMLTMTHRFGGVINRDFLQRLLEQM